jgi:hypothetical protein
MQAPALRRAGAFFAGFLGLWAAPFARHCKERSDAATQKGFRKGGERWIASLALAMTGEAAADRPYRFISPPQVLPFSAKWCVFRHCEEGSDAATQKGFRKGGERWIASLALAMAGKGRLTGPTDSFRRRRCCPSARKKRPFKKGRRFCLTGARCGGIL